jgi:hypothetical protein
LARGIEIFLPATLAEAPVPEVVRASVFEYDWSNVAAAIMDEYTNVLKYN